MLSLLSQILLRTQPNKYLLDAVSANNLDRVRQAIQNGADVNAQNDLGKTALMVAVENRHLDIIKCLITHRANVNACDISGFTPLMRAASWGYKDIVEYLISNGADVNAQDYHKNTPLTCAAGKGYKDIVEYLISNGADVNVRKESGNTVLINAAVEGDLDVVKCLVANKVDVNAQGNDGYTALIQASRLGHFGIIEYLIPNGADVNIEDDRGKVALDHALESSITRHAIEGRINAVKLIANQITRLEAKGLYVSEKNLQLRDQIMPENERRMLLLCDNHKPLIDALPQLGYHGDNTPDKIRTFLEENRARFGIEHAITGKSLIDFIDFEDNATLHTPTLKLCAAVSEVVKNNAPSANLNNPNAEQLQAPAQARN